MSQNYMFTKYNIFIFKIVLNNNMLTTNVFDETKEKIVLKRKKLSSQWKKKMLIMIWNNEQSNPTYEFILCSVIQKNIDYNEQQQKALLI